MKVVFLGTGSAIPTEKKNHPGILLSFGSENILIDCGEGIQRQLRKAKINPGIITKILLTHWHADHTLGLSGLLETLAMSEYSKNLQIIGPEGTKEKIGYLEKIYGKFRLNYKIEEVKSKTLDFDSYLIESLQMSHGIPVNAYSIKIKDKLRLDKQKLRKLKLPNSPLIGELQKGKNIKHPITKKVIAAKSLTYLEKGKKVTVILDTKLIPQAMKIAKGSDLLISEASFTNEHAEKAKEYNHLTSQQAASIAKKSKVKLLALVHTSQRYDKDDSAILLEARKIFKNAKLPNDFDEISI